MMRQFWQSLSVFYFLLSRNRSWEQPCRFTRTHAACVGQLFCWAQINTADFLSVVCISGSSLLWHKVSGCVNFIRDLPTCTWTPASPKSEGLVGITESKMWLCWSVRPDECSQTILFPGVSGETSQCPCSVPGGKDEGLWAILCSLPSIIWVCVFRVWQPPRMRRPCQDREVLPAKTAGKT